MGYSQCDHKELDTTENTRTHLPPRILSSSVLVTQSCPFFNHWTAAHKASRSMGFSRQGYLNGFPFPSPGDLPNPGVEPGSPAL